MAFGLARIEFHRSARPRHGIPILASAQVEVAESTVGKWQRGLELQRTSRVGESFSEPGLPLLRVDPPSHMDVLDVGEFGMRQREIRIERNRLLEQLLG